MRIIQNFFLLPEILYTHLDDNKGDSKELSL